MLLTWILKGKMKSIKLENIRSLKNTGFVDLKPLTILIGENSSGKSTFCRVFPLLKQSRSEAPQGPLLFNGELVDFGSLNNVITRDANVDDITLSFIHEFKYSDFRVIKRDAQPLRLEVALTIGDLGNNIPYIKRVSAKIHEFSVDFYFEKNRVTKVVCDGSDFSPYFSHIPSFDDGRMFPMLFEKQEGLIGSSSGQYKTLVERNPYLTNLTLPKGMALELRRIIASYHRKNASFDRVNSSLNELIRLVFLGTHMDVYFNSTSGRQSSLAKIYKTSKLKDFQLVEKMASIHTALLLLESFNSYMDRCSNNIKYIEPLRATAERYYRARNISIKEVDSRGNNLPIFISSLPNHELVNLQSWLLENFELNLIAVPDGGHISLWVQHNGSQNRFNLTDTGFGFSQVMPLLIQLWSVIFQKNKSEMNKNVPIIYVVEQPELHLHPRMQAVIAKIFCNAVSAAIVKEIDLRILIETHSESIINKIGHIINVGEISNEDVEIIIFNKENSALHTEVQHARYGSNGQLENWPWGFFD